MEQPEGSEAFRFQYHRVVGQHSLRVSKFGDWLFGLSLVRRGVRKDRACVKPACLLNFWPSLSRAAGSERVIPATTLYPEHVVRSGQRAWRAMDATCPGSLGSISFALISSLLVSLRQEEYNQTSACCSGAPRPSGAWLTGEDARRGSRAGHLRASPRPAYPQPSDVSSQ
jgi:hypothetical protein